MSLLNKSNHNQVRRYNHQMLLYINDPYLSGSCYLLIVIKLINKQLVVKIIIILI